MDYEPVPGQIYEDEKGTRWLVVTACHVPTVQLHEIIPFMSGENPPKKISGGVTGLMFKGFRKIAEAPQ